MKASNDSRLPAETMKGLMFNGLHGRLKFLLSYTIVFKLNEDFFMIIPQRNNEATENAMVA